MDWMTKLGGRKFLMALVVIGAALYLELSGKGLSPTMAGFLVAVIGAFSAANYASSATYMKSKPSNGDGSVHKKLDDLTDAVSTGFAPDRTANLQQLLLDIKSGVSQTQALTGQVGQTLINLSQRKN